MSTPRKPTIAERAAQIASQLKEEVDKKPPQKKPQSVGKVDTSFLQGAATSPKNKDKKSPTPGKVDASFLNEKIASPTASISQSLKTSPDSRKKLDTSFLNRKPDVNQTGDSDVYQELRKVTKSVSVKERGEALEFMRQKVAFLKQTKQYTAVIGKISDEQKGSFTKKYDQINKAIEADLAEDIHRVNQKDVTLPADMTMKDFLDLSWIYHCYEKCLELIIDINHHINNHPDKSDDSYTKDDLATLRSVASSINYGPEYYANQNKISSFHGWETTPKQMRELEVRILHAALPGEKWQSVKSSYQDYIEHRKGPSPHDDKRVKFSAIEARQENITDDNVREDIISRVEQDTKRFTK
jgi:hypothetical protein